MPCVPSRRRAGIIPGGRSQILCPIPCSRSSTESAESRCRSPAPGRACSRAPARSSSRTACSSAARNPAGPAWTTTGAPRPSPIGSSDSRPAGGPPSPVGAATQSRPRATASQPSIALIVPASPRAASAASIDGRCIPAPSRSTSRPASPSTARSAAASAAAAAAGRACPAAGVAAATIVPTGRRESQIPPPTSALRRSRPGARVDRQPLADGAEQARRLE